MTAARTTPAIVDPGVAVEMGVFRREERLDDPLGHGRYGHEDAPLAGIFGEQPPIAGMHPGDHRRVVVGEFRIVGKAASELVENGENSAGRDQHDEHETEQQVLGKT